MPISTRKTAISQAKHTDITILMCAGIGRPMCLCCFQRTFAASAALPWGRENYSPSKAAAAPKGLLSPVPAGEVAQNWVDVSSQRLFCATREAGWDLHIARSQPHFSLPAMPECPLSALPLTYNGSSPPSLPPSNPYTGQVQPPLPTSSLMPALELVQGGSALNMCWPNFLNYGTKMLCGTFTTPWTSTSPSCHPI